MGAGVGAGVGGVDNRLRVLVKQHFKETYQSEGKDDAALLAQAHADYGATRWAALTPDDREWCLEREEFARVLRDTGVGGLRFPSQVKCLHAHYAHFLGDPLGGNPVGKRVPDRIRSR